MVKESAHDAGDLGSILGLGRSPEGEHGNPVFLPGESPWIEGYGPWGHKESDTTGQLSTVQGTKAHTL